MAKRDKCRTYFRVVLREVREGVGGNLRRSVKGVAHINSSEQYGEVLLSVENLKYLGTAPNGLPYYYEGWMILANAYKISMGPISIDSKGNGKAYWRFAARSNGNTGIALSEIAGFLVTVEAMDGNPYPTDLVALMGMVEKEEVNSKPTVPPTYPNQPYTGTQWPNSRPIGMAKKETQNMPASMPYSWWPVWMPGMCTEKAPFLFGYHMCDSGIERVAFGFPGLPDQPALTGEVGEWRPTGTDNPYGYWVYHREPQLGAGGQGQGARATG